MAGNLVKNPTVDPLVNLIINFLTSDATVADIVMLLPDHTALLIVAAVGGVISNAAAIRSIGVTATAAPYGPYDPTPSVNLARTHLLVASPTGMIAGLDDPENTLP